MCIRDSVDGVVTVKIYAITGEMARQYVVRGDSVKSVAWELKTSNGAAVSSGTYIIVVEGAGKNGGREVKRVKAAVIKKFDYNSKDIN